MKTKKTAIALGEKRKADVKKERGGLVVYGDCILCDRPVYGSGKGYTTDDVNQDRPIEEIFGDVIVKPLHKWCLTEIVRYGVEFMRAIELKHDRSKIKN